MGRPSTCTYPLPPHVPIQQGVCGEFEEHHSGECICRHTFGDKTVYWRHGKSLLLTWNSHCAVRDCAFPGVEALVPIACLPCTALPAPRTTETQWECVASNVWLSRTLLHLIMSEPADATTKSGPVSITAQRSIILVPHAPPAPRRVDCAWIAGPQGEWLRFAIRCRRPSFFGRGHSGRVIKRTRCHWGAAARWAVVHKALCRAASPRMCARRCSVRPHVSG